MEKSKYNISWISIIVIFFGTIVYPIIYEEAKESSIQNSSRITRIIKVPMESSPSIIVTPIDSPTTSETKKESFTRNLKLGDRGEDVKRLQEFLNQNGFPVALSGAGSLDKETELFGLGTQRALKKFQEAHAEELLKPLGLTSGTGFLGEDTRNLINNL
jgi:hypothetical protein